MALMSSQKLGLFFKGDEAVMILFIPLCDLKNHDSSTFHLIRLTVLIIRLTLSAFCDYLQICTIIYN